MRGNNYLTRKRICTLVCLVILAPLGFWMWRHYHGWAASWFRFYVSSMIYEMVWCLVFFFFWPRRKNIIRIAAGVFIATCGLEFLQLWKPAFLQEFRRTLIGAGLIGTDFVWLQFPFYVLGTMVSVLLLALIDRLNEVVQQAHHKVGARRKE
jgi:hypothetical protein